MIPSILMTTLEGAQYSLLEVHCMYLLLCHDCLHSVSHASFLLITILSVMTRAALAQRSIEHSLSVGKALRRICGPAMINSNTCEANTVSTA